MSVLAFTSVKQLGALAHCHSLGQLLAKRLQTLAMLEELRKCCVFHLRAHRRLERVGQWREAISRAF
jgi:hypothetical protein